MTVLPFVFNISVYLSLVSGNIKRVICLILTEIIFMANEAKTLNSKKKLL